MALGAEVPPKLSEEDGEHLGHHPVGPGLVLGKAGPLWVLRCLRLECWGARVGRLWERRESLDPAASLKRGR